MNDFTSNNDYSVLNLDVLKSSHMNLRDKVGDAEAIFVRHNYLPTVRDNYRDLRNDIDSANVRLREASLNSKMDLEATVRELRYAERDRLRAKPGSSALAGIEQDINDLLTEMFVTTKQEAEKIAPYLATIRQRQAKAFTADLRIQLNEDMEAAKLASQALRADVEKLRAERKVLTDAVDAAEKSGIDEVSKRVGLSIDKIQGLGMAPPQVELVKLAIEQLKASMKDLGEAISFIGMIRECDRLLNVIKDTSSKIAQKDIEVAQSRERIEFINVTLEIDQHRQDYLAVYTEAVAAFRKILQFAHSNKNGGIATRSSAAIEEASRFIAFLAPIYRA